MEHIRTDGAPPPGFYSLGVLIDTSKYNLLFTAGQTGNDPDTDKVVPGGIQGQTMQALKNLKAVISAAGGKISGIRANAAPSHSELKLLCVERAKRLAPTPAVRRCRLLQVFQWSAAADGVWVS